jgi:hypothetical protein
VVADQAVEHVGERLDVVAREQQPRAVEQFGRPPGRAADHGLAARQAFERRQSARLVPSDGRDVDVAGGERTGMSRTLEVTRAHHLDAERLEFVDEPCTPARRTGCGSRTRSSCPPTSCSRKRAPRSATRMHAATSVSGAFSTARRPT